MDKEQMIEQLEDELYGKTTGERTAITVRLGGQQDGLDYGPVLIEVVVLNTDGQTVAFRYSDDAYDGDWDIGTIEDAVEAALEADYAIKDSEKHAAMMAELA